MKKAVYSIFVVAASLFAATTASAQDKVEATMQTDLVSSYLWRGSNLGTASIQPTLGLAYKGLSLSAWGNMAFNGKEYKNGEETGRNVEELDLTLSYTTHGFSIGVTDYYFNYDGHPYFKYASHETSHVWEGYVGYDFGFLSATWYTNFAGADGVNKSGDRAYSSYMEFNAPFRLATCDWTATLGFVPYATSFYPDANGFAVNNVSLKATKDIKITDKFSLPVFAEIMTNPSTQSAWFMAGLTLKPF